MSAQSNLRGNQTHRDVITCPYCRNKLRKQPGITDQDHVPPRSLFAKPRPQLPTVTCCRKCHNLGSKGDEALKMQIAASPLRKDSTHFMQESVFRSMDRNPWWKQSLAVNAENPADCDFGFPGGQLVAKVVRMPPDLESALNQSIWRIAIGTIFLWNQGWDHRNFDHHVYWQPEEDLMALRKVVHDLGKMKPTFVRSVGVVTNHGAANPLPKPPPAFLARGYGFDTADRKDCALVLNFYATCMYWVRFIPRGQPLTKC